MQSLENFQVLGELGIHPSAVVDLSGGFGYGQIKSTQAGIEGGSTTDPTALSNPWSSKMNDKSNYAFVNASWWARPKKVQLSAQYTFSRDMQINTLADTLTAKVPGTNINLPDNFYRTHEVTLQGRWYYTAGIEFACRYDFTKYDLSDPLSQSVPYLDINPAAPATAATAVFLGTNKLNYKANRLQVTASKRF